MVKHNRANGVNTGIIALGAALFSLTMVRATLGEDGRNEIVWIYRGVPAQGEPDNRSPTEKYFQPFFFFPESKAARIVVDIKKPIAKLPGNTDEKGTCIEITFPLEGADEYAGVAFIPGDRVGDKPPLDLTTAGRLTVGLGRPTFLKFAARTSMPNGAKVQFSCVGFRSGEITDDIKSPKMPREETTVLKERWQTVSIDLTKWSEGLSSLACPLRIVCKSNDNPHQDEVTIQVKDIRFEVGPKSESK